MNTLAPTESLHFAMPRRIGLKEKRLEQYEYDF
jgi:hypothetical protein